MNAKISLRHPAVPAIKRDIVAAVRLDGQGFASVELYVPAGTIYAGRLGSWRTLAEVIRHPAVVDVTFSNSPVDAQPDPAFSEDITTAAEELRGRHRRPGIVVDRIEVDQTR